MFNTIYLRLCHNVTDNGLANLKGIQFIDVLNCDQITDVGLAHLKDVQTIDLSYCVSNN